MRMSSEADIAQRAYRKTRGPRRADVKRNLKRYKADPVAFVREVLSVEPAPYQEEIMQAFVKHRRVAARAPHGVGKTATAAWLICWAVGIADVDTKVVTTAGAWRQLEYFLWPEVRKWAANADWSKVGLNLRLDKEILSLMIKTPKALAFAAASNQASLIEGAHATRIFYFFRRGESHRCADLGCSGGRIQHGRSLRLRGFDTGRVVRPLLRNPQPQAWLGRLGGYPRQARRRDPRGTYQSGVG